MSRRCGCSRSRRRPRRGACESVMPPLHPAIAAAAVLGPYGVVFSAARCCAASPRRGRWCGACGHGGDGGHGSTLRHRDTETTRRRPRKWTAPRSGAPRVTGHEIKPGEMVWLVFREPVTLGKRPATPAAVAHLQVYSVRPPFLGVSVLIRGLRKLRDAARIRAVCSRSRSASARRSCASPASRARASDRC